MPSTDVASALKLKSIVYATDFSLCSQNAGLYASRLAGLFSAKLLVAHAFTLTQPAMELEIDSLLISQQRKDLMCLLSQKASTLSGPSIESTPILLEGDPKKVLPKLADQNSPSMVVLGTHGGGWVERSVLGSVAEEILRSTRWPSLTVGPQVTALSNKEKSFERIVFADDLSHSAVRAAPYAAALAEAFDSRLDLLNVTSGREEHPSRVEKLLAHFESSLEEFSQGQTNRFREVRPFVEVGKAHEQILKHIRDHSVDLLVLGVPGTSHLHLEMRLSGVFPLILDSPCPVLTVVSD
jgi:nucleotide-binding universal stress UspA family protein